MQLVLRHETQLYLKASISKADTKACKGHITSDVAVVFKRAPRKQSYKKNSFTQRQRDRTSKHESKAAPEGGKLPCWRPPTHAANRLPGSQVSAGIGK